MIKPHYETYRYTTQICTANSQSIVECRLAGSEIGSILAVHARAVPTEWTCRDGEIRYAGKLFVTIVYEDTERRVCRAERGAEFSHRAEHASITPACFATARWSAENVTTRREGSGLYISVIVGAHFSVFGEAQVNYLYDGEGLQVKREGQPIVRVTTVSENAQADDEFETDYALDVLMHSENAYLSSAEAEDGQIVLSGEIALNLCAIKEDGSLCSYERLVPFRVEIPCEDSMPQRSVSGNVYVKHASLSVATDEEKGKCRIEAEIGLCATAELYVCDEIPACVDAYSTEKELALKKEQKEGRRLVGMLRFTERVNGTASLSEPIDYSVALQAALMPRAEIACKNGEAEGAVFADLVLADADKIHKSARLSLPFLFPVNAGEGVETEAEAIVCGLCVRQRKEGEAEAEATLKVVVKLYEKDCAEYVCEAIEGEAHETSDSAISIYLPHAGDGLWETAKRLRCKAEELEKSNPELKFPLCGNERIFVYRQKT